jgi:hypothetical protein
MSPIADAAGPDVFSDRAALNAWLDSPSRRRFAAQAERGPVPNRRVAIRLAPQRAGS